MEGISTISPLYLEVLPKVASKAIKANDSKVDTLTMIERKPVSLASEGGLEKAFFLDNQSINRLKYDQDADSLMQVAHQFEALFVQQMLKNMRATTQVLGDEDNPLSMRSADMFQDMLDGQLAHTISQTSNFGIADVLYRQLANNPDSRTKGEDL
ncbi:flagellar protein FlgJ [Vibrio astriarenae]|nr:flagellar protein FlgJ [Vibrio sp. C7]